MADASALIGAVAHSIATRLESHAEHEPEPDPQPDPDDADLASVWSLPDRELAMTWNMTH